MQRCRSSKQPKQKLRSLSRHTVNLWGKASHVRSVRDKDGVVLTKPEYIRGHWKEHFEQLYNANIRTDASVLLDLLTGENEHDTPNCWEKK